MEISLLLIAALLYLGLALGFILAVDKLVGLVFRDSVGRCSGPPSTSAAPLQRRKNSTGNNGSRLAPTPG